MRNTTKDRAMQGRHLMYVKRALATGLSAAVAAGVLAVAPMASGSTATTSADQTMLAAAAKISCTTKTYRTVGRVTCTGTGLYRANATCRFGHKTSGWVRITNSTSSAYAKCRTNIREVRADTRPGA